MPAEPLVTRNLPTLRQRLALRSLALCGWRVLLAPFPGPHAVVIIYPHTSNWDFIIGLFAKWAMGIPFRWLAKPSFFRGFTGVTLGRLMRHWGGEPIERDISTGAITRLAQRMRSADRYVLVITPEGTRSYRPYWRSGFYYVARAAGVPVSIGVIDYARKEVGVIAHIALCGELDRDLDAIRAAYTGRHGLHPALEAPIVFQQSAIRRPEQ